MMMHLQKEDQCQLAQDLERKLPGPAVFKKGNNNPYCKLRIQKSGIHVHVT